MPTPNSGQHPGFYSQDKCELSSFMQTNGKKCIIWHTGTEKNADLDLIDCNRGEKYYAKMGCSHYYCSPGQQRSRMLATLFKDERCQQLAAYGILEKMYLDRIIRGNQLQEFAAMLMPHQKATTADGTCISCNMALSFRVLSRSTLAQEQYCTLSS